MKANYNLKWYWWLLLFITFPAGWLIAVIILDDMYDPSIQEWNDYMEEVLKENNIE